MTQELRWTPFAMLLRREIARFFKVIVQTVVTPLINSSLYLLIFGVSLGQSIRLSSQVSYLAFLIPGLVMMGCLNNAFQNASSSVVTAKFSGDLEDLRVAPLSSQQIIWAMSIAGLFRGLIVGGITFFVGSVFYWVYQGELLRVEHPGALAFFIVVGGLAFSQLGMSVAFWARSMDQLTAVGSFVLTPLLYLGGVFFSLDNLHPFWQSVSQFNPLLYLINGVRYGLLGVSDVPVGLAAVVAVGTLAVFYGIAYRSLRTGSFLRW